MIPRVAVIETRHPFWEYPGKDVLCVVVRQFKSVINLQVAVISYIFHTDYASTTVDRAPATPFAVFSASLHTLAPPSTLSRSADEYK
jgi:hypothetical protein